MGADGRAGGLHAPARRRGARCSCGSRGVWNDVRTVLLLVVLMFLATSVTFDELLVMEPERGRWYFIGGLVFSIASDGRAPSRHPPQAAAPVPLAVSPHAGAVLPLPARARAGRCATRTSETLMWGLWGFAPAAGLVFLTLIPAIRRGREYLRDNGSPWPWPFYPVVGVRVPRGRGRAAVRSCCAGRSTCLPTVRDDRTHLRPVLPRPVRPGAGGSASRNRDRRGQPRHAVDGAGRFRSRSSYSPRSVTVPMRSTPSSCGTSTRRSAGCRSLSRLSRPAGSISTPAAGACQVRWRERRLCLAALAFVKPETLTLRRYCSAANAAPGGAVLLQVVVGLWRRDAWRLALGVAVASGGLGRSCGEDIARFARRWPVSTTSRWG